MSRSVVGTAASARTSCPRSWATWPAATSASSTTSRCVGRARMGANDVSEWLVVRAPSPCQPFTCPTLTLMTCHVLAGQGPSHASVTACASSAHAIGDSYRLIKYGDADVSLQPHSQGGRGGRGVHRDIYQSRLPPFLIKTTSPTVLKADQVMLLTGACPDVLAGDGDGRQRGVHQRDRAGGVLEAKGPQHTEQHA